MVMRGKRRFQEELNLNRLAVKASAAYSLSIVKETSMSHAVDSTVSEEVTQQSEVVLSGSTRS